MDKYNLGVIQSGFSKTVTSSKGMYFGDVSDNEPAVIQRVTLKQLEDRNYITGVYAPAGEVVKVEISSEDLEATGGLSISIGQMSHRILTTRQH